MESILRIEQIEKYYGNKLNLTKAIDNISFDVNEGEFVAIMGASGSGKTTLLNCISTIDKVTSGHIFVGGEDITNLKGNKLNKFRREKLGFIFQDFNLLDTLTAYENIALSLSIQNVPATKIDEAVKKVADLSELAPLHNPANIIGYKAFKEALPDHVGHVFVFDTAFHQTLDKERYLYPLPLEYYTDLKVRKYGAHGTSHKYVSQQAIEMLGNPKESRIIVCHLGNGASISAVQDGKCIDTSMGFTPLAGVMMGTRSGDVDPSVMPYLCKKLNKTADEVLEIYNKKSGMLGISGISSDSRDIENALFNEGNERALLTGLLYARIVSKYIGQYYAELGGCDAICFTAGVGENAAYLRRLIIDNVSRAFGVFLDEELNSIRSDENRVISHQYSQIKVMVIPTNEEVMIARDTVRLLDL